MHTLKHQNIHTHTKLHPSKPGTSGAQIPLETSLRSVVLERACRTYFGLIVVRVLRVLRARLLSGSRVCFGSARSALEALLSWSAGAAFLERWLLFRSAPAFQERAEARLKRCAFQKPRKRLPSPAKWLSEALPAREPAALRFGGGSARSAVRQVGGQASLEEIRRPGSGRAAMGW